MVAAPPDPRRLAWRCRRGMKELDILLARWLQQQFPNAGDELQTAFAQLLELPDPELAGYLLAGVPPADPRYRQLVASMIGRD
jgi:antitoxin CptB